MFNYFNRYNSIQPVIKDTPESIIRPIKENNIIELQKQISNIPRITTINISKGSQPQLSTRNLSALHVAAMYDALDSFIFLERELNINPLIQTPENYTPFHYACYYNSYEIAMYLICKFPNEAKRIYPNTKFQYIYLCTMGKASKILDQLFKHGAIFQNMNPDENPINYAIKMKYVDILTKLLEYAPKTKSEQGQTTPIIHAVVNSQPNAVPLLLEHGIDPCVYTAEGRTALFINLFTLKNVELTRILCNAMDNVDIPESIQKMAAVHYVCYSGSPEIAKIVLAKGINVNRIDENHAVGPKHLVDIASEQNALEILKLLFDYGYDVNLRYDNQSNTALGEFMLGINPYPQIVEFLISKNANIDLPCFNQNVKTSKNDNTIRAKLLKKRVYEKICAKYDIKK